MTMARPARSRLNAGEPTVFTWPLDPVLLLAAVFLLFSGIVMVASASVETSARLHNAEFFMFLKHCVYVVLALGAGGLALSVPIAVWQRLAYPLLALSFLLLIAVLVPGIGKTVNGSTRWISLGAFSLQGSEFVKLFVVVFAAAWLVQFREEVTSGFVGFLKPLAIVSGLVLLLLGQPDFGASVVIMGTVLGMMFLAGVSLVHFVPTILACLIMASSLIVLQPERFDRFIAFTDPWAHQFEGGYQLTQALIAFGRAEWFGLGLGNSIQKLFFLPEAHTDFLFSIIAEELGVLGALAIIAGFVCLVLRGAWIGRMAENRGEYFHAWLAYGIALLLGIQASINICVNIGLLPTKGLTLPLMSYGGNSLIISCMLIAVLLRVEWECRRGEYDGTAGRRSSVRRVEQRRGEKRRGGRRA